MTSAVQYAQVSSARLAYRLHSSGDNRPPLVFAHGYAMQSTGPAYRELLSLLAASFDVYALDMRGHGQSASEVANWSLEALADDVAEFAEGLQLRSPVYVGHSIGGFTGMYAAIRHPGTFSALCLLTTAAASGGSHAPAEAGTFLIENSKDQRMMVEHFAAMYVRPEPNEVEHAARSIGLMDRSVHETFFATYPGCVITSRLNEIQSPVLVLNGARDIIVPPSEQHTTALGLSRSKEVTFSGEGHMMPMEAASVTAREIINFCLHDLPETFGR